VAVYFSIALLISACATGSAYAPMQSERFGSGTLAVQRVAIISNMPRDFISRVADPLTAQLSIALKRSGFDTVTDVQVTNPLALGTEISFGRAQKLKPSAYLIVKFASGNSYGNVKLRFEFLDETRRGVWRGSMTIHRLADPEKVMDQVAKEIVDKLVDDGVIAVAPRGQEA